jgi:hypothetical protein
VAFVTLLETDHLGMVRGQQGGNTLLGDWVDIVVHRHTRRGRGGHRWHVNEGCAVDGGHGSRLGLLLRMGRMLDVLWVVRGI